MRAAREGETTMIMYAIADNNGPINNRTFTTRELAEQVLNDTCYHPKVYDGRFRVIEVTIDPDAALDASRRLAEVYGFAQFTRLHARKEGLESLIQAAGQFVRQVSGYPGSRDELFRVLA